MRRPATVLAGGMLLLAGCTSGGGDDGGAGAAPDAPACEPSEVGRDASGFAEVAGAGDGAETWALLWVTPPWRVDDEVKVVWRMTGAGDLSVRAIGPDGESVEPTSGPTYHTGSSWTRPGDEWGTVFRLPAEGCWVLEARRGDAVSTVGIPVGTA